MTTVATMTDREAREHARRIPGLRHGGLLQLAATGEITPMMLESATAFDGIPVGEIDSAPGVDFDGLFAYIRLHGVRPRVEGWGS